MVHVLEHPFVQMTQLLEAAISKLAVLELEPAAGLPAVEGAATQIRQIVMNLIMNASDALGGKKGRITVRTGTLEANREALDATYLKVRQGGRIVPVAAMAFGIAKGFGFQKMLEKQLYENFPGQDEVVGQVVVFAQSMLETTQSGVIAGIGLVLTRQPALVTAGPYLYLSVYGIDMSAMTGGSSSASRYCNTTPLAMVTSRIWPISRTASDRFTGSIRNRPLPE